MVEILKRLKSRQYDVLNVGRFAPDKVGLRAIAVPG